MYELFSGAWIKRFNDEMQFGMDRTSLPEPGIQYVLGVVGDGLARQAIVSAYGMGYWLIAPSDDDTGPTLPMAEVRMSYLRRAAGQEMGVLYRTGQLIRGYRVRRGFEEFQRFFYQHLESLTASTVVFPAWPLFTIHAGRVHN